MSLASLLLPSSFEPSKKAKTIDTELDALFRTQPSSSISKKRKRGQGEPTQHAKKSKYEKAVLDKGVASESMDKDRKKGRQEDGVEVSRTKKKDHHDDKTMLIDEDDLEKKLDDDEDGSEDNSDLENAYYRAHLKRQPPSLKVGDDTTDEDKSSSEDALDAPGPDAHLHDVSTPASASDFESDGDPSMLVHETAASPKKTISSRRMIKYVPPGETSEQRDLRTIFVGNLSIEVAQNRMFGERMIRVDVALQGTARAKHKSSLGDVGMGGADPKFSVFVGNLDFESREEDLRVYFEGVIAAERGPPEDAMERDDGDEDAENDQMETKLKKPKPWVTRVRIVRDKETQLGKGFAYVQFADRQCVDEILAMEEGKLKFAKRKLRVQRCKTIPGVTIPSKSLSTSTTTKPPNAKIATVTHRRPIPVPVVPKGDPTLGAKLAGMSKYERKEVKATNADRIARRLAKKKARIAFGNASVKVVRKESGEKTRERRRHPRDA
ncbi:hypothetical protein BDN72DRAFT_849568 [Pluteus cervinus]|uniref:Uncharacterized protein n=1 Tax=Pluteus cervinus TaxID=181527 RepID=A0ACD3A7D0_9AGAR|nr:hypothetical protein BDN72DRAFT_849568 [Pluteus cervinus]